MKGFPSTVCGVSGRADVHAAVLLLQGTGRPSSGPRVGHRVPGVFLLARGLGTCCLLRVQGLFSKARVSFTFIWLSLFRAMFLGHVLSDSIPLPGVIGLHDNGNMSAVCCGVPVPRQCEVHGAGWYIHEAGKVPGTSPVHT